MKPNWKAVKKRSTAYFTALAQKQNNQLFDRLVNSEPFALRPGLRVSTLLAMFIATLVHLVSILLVVGALYIVVHHYSEIFWIAIALFLLLLAWVLRPRFGKIPKEYLTKAQAPTLYWLANTIADTLKTSRVERIMLDFSVYNAAFIRAGLPSQRILLLGKPLWDTLSTEEQIALIAHEFAHSLHNDSFRHQYIFSAVHALMMWFSLLRPATLFPRGMGIFVTPILLVYFMVSHTARLSARALLLLMWHTSRRAEYLADYRAATIAGTKATMYLIGKLYYGSSFEMLTKTTQYNTTSERIRRFEQLRTRINTLDLNALEEINNPSEEEIARLDLSHPPLGYRMRLLKSHPITDPKIVVTPAQVAQIADEVNKADKQRKRLLSVYDADFTWSR